MIKIEKVNNLHVSGMYLLYKEDLKTTENGINTIKEILLYRNKFLTNA